METVEAVVGVMLVLALVGFSSWVAVSIIEFIVKVPKQLKRIADALEKRK